MKKIEFKWEDNKIYSYTYNSFNDDIRDYYDFEDYLNNNFQNLDFTKVDKFVDYIYDVIDDMDYVFIEGLEGEELELYKDNLSYVYYDKISYYGDIVPNIYTKYLFDIRDKKNKNFLKQNIKFNLCNEYQDIMVVDTDREYILNDDSRGPDFVKVDDRYFFKNEKPYYYNYYHFVKNGIIQLVLAQHDGYIHDYRDIDELYFLKRKDLKVKNSNFISYDYTRFSNDVNDDKYISYIHDIVDNVDYVFMNNLSYDEECKYKDKLNYTYYDRILLKDESKYFNADYIFDIKDKESKQLIKDDIKFNLSDNNRNPILIDANKKYIMNEVEKREYEYMDYCFIKNDYLEVVLHQRDGYIDDYRSADLIGKELKKYKN